MGFKSLESYWGDLVKEIEIDYQKNSSSAVEKELKEYKHLQNNLLALCLALKEIYYQYPGPLESTSEFNTDHYIPFLKNIKKLNEKPLEEIYKKIELGTETKKSYVYLCVIAYDKFFDVTENSLYGIDREYMLSYFQRFNTTMKSNNSPVLRIFTMPGKYTKRKGWQSNHTYNENLNLFSYAYLNSKISGFSIVLFYDENKERREILAKLDYVLRIEIPNQIIGDDDLIRRMSEKFISETDLP